MRFALEPTVVLHTLEQGGNSVGVAAHGASQFALGETGGVTFAQGPQGGELVGRGAGMANLATEGLIQAVPGAAQQQRQAFALGRVDGQIVVEFFSSHAFVKIVRTGMISALHSCASKANHVAVL